MRLFIDTNIYLNFFRVSNEKANSLETLRTNLKDKNINLVFPHVTQNEFFKNLPAEKLRYVQQVKDLRFDNPQIVSIIHTPERKKRIVKLIKDLEQEKKKIIDDYLTHADKLVAGTINFLIDNALAIHESQAVIDKANTRRLLGYPPGKDKMEHHIGDEVVWELLLSHCADDDLIIIAADSDWKEINLQGTDDYRIKDFLTAEWQRSSNKQLRLYTTLGEYINDNLGLKDKISPEEIKEEKDLSTIVTTLEYPATSLTLYSSEYNRPGYVTISGDQYPYTGRVLSVADGIISSVPATSASIRPGYINLGSNPNPNPNIISIKPDEGGLNLGGKPSISL